MLSTCLLPVFLATVLGANSLYCTQIVEWKLRLREVETCVQPERFHAVCGRRKPVQITKTRWAEGDKKPLYLAYEDLPQWAKQTTEPGL